jgi:PPOX class probable F420-dependent enzyme
MTLPGSVTALLERKVFAHLATVQPDGSPQVSAVWVHHRHGRVMFNTAEGRVKTRNLEHDPRVAVSLLDPDDPYCNLTLRGSVAAMSRHGADADIDFLAAKYLGLDEYPYRQEGEVRVTVLVEVESVAW